MVEYTLLVLNVGALLRSVLCEKYERKRRRKRFHSILYCRAEWHKPSSLVENIIETSTVRIIPAQNNYWKFFHSATRAPPPERMSVVQKERKEHTILTAQGVKYNQ